MAYAFGAVLEGAGGGGAPVAICGAMMVGLGFKPFEAAVLCLIANTAPVASGGMGSPIRMLAAVTGLPEMQISATVGRILPWTALILPFWLIHGYAGWRQTMQVWPGLLARGAFFAAVQFLWSNYVDAALVDIMGGMLTLVFLAALYRWRRPGTAAPLGARAVITAWSPFLILAVLVVLWGLPSIKAMVDAPTWRMPVPGLHNLVQRTAPVVAKAHTEPALFDIAWLSAVGTPTFFARAHSGAATRTAAFAHAGGVLAGLRPDALFDGGDTGDARAGIHHALLGHGRGDGAGAEQHRLAVSVLRDVDRVAGRGADGNGRGIERAVREPAGGRTRWA